MNEPKTGIEFQLQELSRISGKRLDIKSNTICELEKSNKIKEEIISSLRCSNEYLLNKLVKIDIEKNQLKEELKNLK